MTRRYESRGVAYVPTDPTETEREPPALTAAMSRAWQGAAFMPATEESRAEAARFRASLYVGEDG